MELTFPSLEEHPLDLVPSRVTRGGASDRLPHGVTIGGPQTRPLTPDTLDGDDAELKHFLASEQGTWDYHLILLVCTFHRHPDGPFTDGLLGVTFPPASAWSLAPDRDAHIVKVGRSVKLGAKAAFGVVEVGPEVGRTDEVEKDEVFIQSYGAGDSEPYWELRTTRKRGLEGDHNLTIVARAPAGTDVEGTVSVEATLRGKKLGVIPYKAAAPAEDPVTFRLAAPPTP